MKHTLKPVRGWGWGLLLAAVISAAFRVTAQTCDPSPSGLISWWPGDGNANDIFSTNNGNLVGTTVDTPGYVDTTFWFDGTNDYVWIPDEPVLHPATMTIEAWVRCDLLDTPAINSYPGQQYLIFHQNTEEEGFEGFDLAKDREPRFTGTTDTWCFEMTSTSGQNVYVESVTQVHTNVWYHLAGVHGSNYIQLYVNGKLEGQTNVAFPMGFGNFPLYFGTTGQSYWDHKFGGALDEIGFYDRALSSNEIAAIYAAGHAGKCKSPTIISIAMSTNAGPSPQIVPQLTIGGLAGQAYGIQAAPTLPATTNGWIGLTNQTLPASTNSWLDPTPVAGGQRFYRVKPGTITVP